MAFSRITVYVGRKKTELERQLAESIKAVKQGRFPKRSDALGNRLRHLDGVDRPDALADPDDLPSDDEDDE